MAKKTKQSPVEAFLSLSDAQKEQVWESFNREIPLSETQPLTADETAQWKQVVAKARRGRGRPKIGGGAQRVQVTVERKLLARADAYAESKGLSRAQLISMGLRKLVG
ncbi:type II toxin-antitoxin system HicB family antitoxin [Humisphaera borealis]|uniref:Uncharacterized protein n=1 Tax=Humisphaera borealis TaxID=2807512 RepID=A0A7M2X3D2_9BACT|nr:hypothetical protein [Humisphaera borealis]QOV92268.1 hypothetical protein IPV69_13285 [Humisphaera borealis]